MVVIDPDILLFYNKSIPHQKKKTDLNHEKTNFQTPHE